MGRENNNLIIWGNKESMNLNSMILTNIQSSTYFKEKLYKLKTYHEVIDEIYYRVTHLEPWEKGSRRTQGLTGMCGGVRGVGGGGIVSTAFCLLYKLYTLKLTRKQVIGLMTHRDSPFIRALGFMYVRYTQNPQDLWYWYCDYLDDDEELDVKAGGGAIMTIGQMLRQWLIRLEWYDTLFPRIPVPIQKEIMDALRERYGNRVDSDSFLENFSGASNTVAVSSSRSKRSPPPEIAEALKGDARRSSRSRSRERSRNKSRSRSRSRSKRSSPGKKRSHRHRSRSRSKSKSRSRSRSRSHHRRRHRNHHHKKENKHRHSDSGSSESSDDDRHSRRHRREEKREDNNSNKNSKRHKDNSP